MIVNLSCVFTYYINTFSQHFQMITNLLLHIFIFTNSCCVLLSSLHYIIILSLFHYYYRYENHVKCNHEKCNEYIIKFTSSLPNVTSLFQRRPLSHIFTYFRSLNLQMPWTPTTQGGAADSASRAALAYTCAK